MELFPTMIDYETFLSATYYNQSPLEQTNFIQSTGILTSNLDLHQTGKSVANYAASGNSYIDSGIADNYVLLPYTNTGIAFNGITQYFPGAKFRFKPLNDNTGACSVSINSLSPISIKLQSGSNPIAGDIKAGVYTEITYDSPNFILENPAITVGENLADYATGADYYIDSGASNAYILTNATSPIDFQEISQYFTGMRIRFTALNANTAASTVNINGLGVKNIKITSATNPKPGDIPSLKQTEMVYDGTEFIIQNPPVSNQIVISNYSSAGDYYVDSGSVDTYILTPAAGYQAISQYTIGGRIRFLPTASNTGDCTVNVNSLGTVNIKLSNTANPTALDIQRGAECILYYDGSNFVLVNPLGSSLNAYPTGYQYKAKIASNIANADLFVDFEQGSVRDQSDLFNIVLSTFFTKNISVDWSPGNGGGGMGSTYDVNTCYACFLIADSDGNVDAGFDSDFNAGNLLAASGFTYYRRRGYVLTDADGNIRHFYVVGNHFWYQYFTDTQIIIGNSSTPTLVSTRSPPAQLEVQLFHSIVAGAGINTAAIVSPLGEQPTINTAGYYTAYTTVPTGDEDMISARLSVVTNDTPQVYLIANVTDASNSLLYTMGWYDPLED